jgi:hypothetical protein
LEKELQDAELFRLKKDAGTTTILERVENNMLKCYGHVVRMEVKVA